MARILVLLVVVLALCHVAHLQQLKKQKWWETASFYQIYPRSFKDSDGDGVGDLKGVMEKLPYLKELGITATWLSPIFTSPMADFGYDIANFTEIDPIFGTMEDFEALIAKAKEVGVKIILDFVPNHSSDECDWFIKSANKNLLYSNYYVWHPGKIVNGERVPPTNWISVFRGSQWTWHEGRQEYYLHQFLAKQPDFNYRNPRVKEMMKDVLRFWLRKGASGFRVDAVPHVFEVAPDSNGSYPDEPRNFGVSDKEDYGYLDHIYTVHQPETIELVYEFRAVMEEMKEELGTDEDLILMTEAYAPMDVLMQYYGNDEVDGAHIPFNFELINSLTSTSNAYEYDQLIRNWLLNMPPGRTANWVLGNHDKSRVGTRMGSDRIDMMNMLLFTLPGCSVTYQGEEIGMTDVWISWNDTIDPQACQSNPNEYERLSRDPVRTPFQWNDESMSGFTDGASTWLPVADNYRSVNVKRERSAPQSHLNIFKELKALRNELAFRQGDTDVRALNANVLVIKRWIFGSDTFIVLLNINDGFEEVDLTTVHSDLKATLTYALVTPKSLKRKGDTVRASEVILLPKEAVILRSAA